MLTNFWQENLKGRKETSLESCVEMGRTNCALSFFYMTQATQKMPDQQFFHCSIRCRSNIRLFWLHYSSFQTSCHIAHPKSPTGVPPFLLQWGLPVMSMIALMNGTSVILVSMLLLPVLTKSSLHFPWVQSHAAFLQTLSLGLLVASSHSKIVRGRQTDNTGSKVIS